MTATQRNRYFVYVMTNSTHRLYVGVTNDIEKKGLPTQEQTHRGPYQEVQHHMACPL